MARHWFQKVRSGDLSLDDKSHSGRPQASDDGGLQATIEKKSNLTCCKVSRQFKVSAQQLNII